MFLDKIDSYKEEIERLLSEINREQEHLQLLMKVESVSLALIVGNSRQAQDQARQCKNGAVKSTKAGEGVAP